MRNWCRVWGLIGGLLFISGCGSPATTPDASQSSTPAAVLAPPDDAAATVTAFAQAMKNGKVEQAYDLLPASYQKDIDTLVHEFAGQMDTEIWSTGFRVLEKATGLLKTKKELLLSMAKQPGREAQMEQLEANWDGVVAGLEKMVTSDLAQIEKLRSGSTRDHLQKGVGPLAKSVLSMATVRNQDGAATLADLDKVKAEVVTSTDTTATVKVTGPNKEEPETVEFTKVDGKWIPKSMADTWSKNIAEAREQIKAIDQDTIAAQKPKVMQMFTTANGVLDEMMKAETPEQIQQAAFPLILQAMMMGSQMGGPPKPASKPSVAQVTITIGQELSDEDLEKLDIVLKELVEDSDNRSVTSAKVDGKTIVTVSPVDDVKEFAKKFTIAKELEIDEDNNAIMVEKIVFE